MNNIYNKNGVVPNSFGALAQAQSDSDSGASNTSTVTNVSGTEVSVPKTVSIGILISNVEEAIKSDRSNDPKLDLVKFALKQLQEVGLETNEDLKTELLPEARKQLRRAWSMFSAQKDIRVV